MYIPIRIGILSLVLPLLLLVPAGTQESTKNDITLKVVKYDELTDIITKNRGKVILIDFYTDICVPCKKAFPHIVEMNRKYTDKGLVTISVSLDPWGPDGFKEEMRGVVLKYLNKTNARMTNLILNENADFIRDRLRIGSVPNIYVFDRQGRWTQFNGERLSEHKEMFEDGKTAYVKYTEVEQLVQKLLEK